MDLQKEQFLKLKKKTNLNMRKKKVYLKEKKFKFYLIIYFEKLLI